MTEILPSASYVHSAKGRDAAARPTVLALLEESALDSEQSAQLWRLLETPQTVESLCRSLGTEEDTGIRAALGVLYEDELIDLSPDT